MPVDPSEDTPYCLLYDGQCPICSAFAGLADKVEGGRLQKIDARQESLLRTKATAAGMNLDYGVVLEHQDCLYYGADALAFLAQQKRRNPKAALLYLPFYFRRLSRLIYPLLVYMRRLILWAAHKKPINNLASKS